MSNKGVKGEVYTFPMWGWLFLFFIVPMLIIILYAFLTKGTYGGIEFILTLENFKVFVNYIIYQVIWRTLYLTIIITAITLIIAIPTAYYIARSKYKEELLFLVIIPFWTSFLIRIYAWMAILGDNGIVNNILSVFHLPRMQFLYNSEAIILISVYTSLPFAILPLYSAIEKFDFSLVEAARDLGATNFQGFIKVFIPNIKAGIVTAGIFTLVPNLGSYAVPNLVGGTNSTMLGTLIGDNYLLLLRDWPKASAVSLVLIIATGITLYILRKHLSQVEEK